MNDTTSPLTVRQRAIKRTFDVTVAACLLLPALPVISALWIAVSLSTARNGIFSQTRIGGRGRPFTLYKLRTMRDIPDDDTNATASIDPRITRLGRLLRRYKLDELPQLLNVLRGDMSLVGPRPEVPGYADELEGEERLILTVRPGITGPATLAFRDEEELLAEQEDPQRYNDLVLFPTKVQINLDYVRNYRFVDDLRYLWLTITGQRLQRPPMPNLRPLSG